MKYWGGIGFLAMIFAVVFGGYAILSRGGGPSNPGPDKRKPPAGQSAKPALEWFNIIVEPGVLNIIFQPDPNTPLRIVVAQPGAAEAGTWHFPHQSKEYAGMVGAVSKLAKNNRILELPQTDAANAFNKDKRANPSVHIEIAYSDNRYWKSWYPMDKVPPQVQAFFEGCRALASQTVERLPRQDAPPAPKPTGPAKPPAGAVPPKAGDPAVGPLPAPPPAPKPPPPAPTPTPEPTPPPAGSDPASGTAPPAPESPLKDPPEAPPTAPN